MTLLTALGLFLAVLGLTGPILVGGRPEALNLEVIPGLALAFKVEPLGLLFALVASSLWIVTSIYSIGYMRGNNEPRQTSFYVCFAVALGSAIGIAFAKNLFTLFLFYELLTLSTYPLVTHKATAEAVRAGRIYLVMLLGTSMVLLLPAIVATWVVAGTVDFTPGGILEGKASGWVIGLLLGLYVFGIGKAAIMPLHFWLPAAMVAPTPVSALLHAVAVVKAGVFAILKVVVYVFGLDLLSQTGAAIWLVYVASFTVLAASLVALHKDNLKARLAYSTISQLAYVVLGAVVASSAGVIGAGMQIAMHAAGKITLFFCAGAIYVATHKTEVSELDGIGSHDARDHVRLPGRLAQHHRHAAARRHLEQMVPGPRSARRRPYVRHRRPDAELAAQRRLPDVGRRQGVLQTVAGARRSERARPSAKRRSPAS